MLTRLLWGFFLSDMSWCFGPIAIIRYEGGSGLQLSSFDGVLFGYSFASSVVTIKNMCISEGFCLEEDTIIF